MSECADVRIRWLSTQEGGREMPAHVRASDGASYKPHFRVGSDGEYLGIAFLEGDPPIVTPGDEGTATVALIYTDNGVDYSPLVPGAAFEVLEGTRSVARGVVLRRYVDDVHWHERVRGGRTR